MKTIFLYDQMNRMIYIVQSKNFEKKSINSFKTCLLNIDLYNLMQNSHFRFDEIKETLIEYSLTQSKHDETFFLTLKKAYTSLFM